MTILAPETLFYLNSTATDKNLVESHRLLEMRNGSCIKDVP